MAKALPANVVVPELSKDQGIMVIYYTYGYSEDAHASAVPTFRYDNIYNLTPSTVQGQLDSFKRNNGPQYRIKSHHLLMCRVGQSVNDLYESITQALFGHFPWADHDFWSRHNHRSVAHMPWFSAKHPGLLTYYQSEAKRAADIRTPIKAGKYLQKFYADVLTADQIQELGILFSTWATPVPLQISSDADEIERIYVNGPSSCMSYEAEHFSGSCHPSRVYAGPDLAVAYIGPLEAPEARCVVWPAKMLHSRVYGDHHRMASALSVAGFKSGSMKDARIQRLWDEEYDDYVVPYVDDCARAEDKDGFLILGSGHISVRETFGLSEAPTERATCDQCEVRVDADDITRFRGENYCEACCSEHLFTCEMTGERHSQDAMLAGVDDIAFGPDALTSGLIKYCDATEMYYPLHCAMQRGYWYRATYTFVEMASGESWVEEHFDEHGSTCSITGLHYPTDELVTAFDGSLHHAGALAAAA